MTPRQFAALWGCAGLLIGFVIGGVLRSHAPTPPPVTPAGGRFQVFMSPLKTADEYLVDTQTGECWVFGKTQDGQNLLTHVPLTPVPAATTAPAH